MKSHIIGRRDGVTNSGLLSRCALEEGSHFTLKVSPAEHT